MGHTARNDRDERTNRRGRMILSRSEPRRQPSQSDSLPISEKHRRLVRLPGIDDYTPAVCRTNHLSSFLERFGVNLDQDHREVLVRGAALMRSAARYDDQISFLNLDGLAVDDTRTAPLAGISLFWRLELATEHQRRGYIQHVVNIVRSVVQFRRSSGLVLFMLHRDAQLHAGAVDQFFGFVFGLQLFL